jgi:hypothetical protein
MYHGRKLYTDIWRICFKEATEEYLRKSWVKEEDLPEVRV